MDKGAGSGAKWMRRLGFALLGLALLALAAGCVFEFNLANQRQTDLNASGQKLQMAQAQLQELKAKKQRPIVVFGDTRTNHDMHEKVVGEIYKTNPEAIFHLGDAVEDGTKADQWQIFNRIEGKLIDNFNFYIAAGNHDKESSLYYDNFALPGNEKWYSINYQNVHWVVLNSNVDLMPGSPQYAWLEADLAKPREKTKFTAIVLHQSIYTSANHATDKVGWKDSLVALLQKYNVKVVFSGHDHDYERSYDGKIYYLVCGSAGAPLYQKTHENAKSQKFVSTYNYCVVEGGDATLTVSAYNENSQNIDMVTIK